MNKSLKQYLKSYRFWLAIGSAIFIILENILKHFNIDLNEDDFMFVVNIVLGVFVFLGIISYPNEDDFLQNDDDKNSEKVLKNNKNNENNEK